MSCRVFCTYCLHGANTGKKIKHHWSCTRPQAAREPIRNSSTGDES